MERVYLDKDIFVIKNFLSDDEISKFPKNLKEVRSRVSSLFNDEYLIKGLGFVRTQLPEDFDYIHYDSHRLTCVCEWCSKNGQLRSKYAFVIYLNDDFSGGGEITYFYQNIVYQPEKGSLICHLGTSEYTHRVSKIKEGERKSVFFWIEETN